MLMFDSGAYSEFQGGPEIKLPNYVRFIKDNLEFIDLFVNLDVIPGRDGRRFADVKAAERTYRNQQIMKDAGLSPLAVHHRQDPMRFLERYLADGERYLCLAAHPTHQVGAIAHYLDQCFALFKGGDIKVHLLGIGSPALLRNYPRLTSVDNSSWVTAAKVGLLLTPVYPGDRPDYSFGPIRMSVTDESSLRRNHIDRVKPRHRQQVERFIKEEVGVTRAQVRRSKFARMRVCSAYSVGVAATTSTRFFHVTSIDPEQQRALFLSGAHDRLLSYARLQGKGALENYMRREAKMMTAPACTPGPHQHLDDGII